MALSSIEEVLKHNEEQCKTSVSAFKRDLIKLRTGRASPGLIEGVMVDYYGSKTALGHLGQISAPEARLLVVQVYDSNAAPAVEKAIHASQLGLNPSREGNTVRITIPQLTEESRKELVRLLHRMAEDMRVSIRNHRREANEVIKTLEKDGKATKDESKRGLEKVQKQIDRYIEEIDKILEAKEAECLEV